MQDLPPPICCSKRPRARMGAHAAAAPVQAARRPKRASGAALSGLEHGGVAQRGGAVAQLKHRAAVLWCVLAWRASPLRGNEGHCTPSLWLAAELANGVHSLLSCSCPITSAVTTSPAVHAAHSLQYHMLAALRPSPYLKCMHCLQQTPCATAAKLRYQSSARCAGHLRTARSTVSLAPGSLSGRMCCCCS